MFFGLLYFCVVILCVNRSRSSFILYRIVKRHSRQSNVRRIWTCADNGLFVDRNCFETGTGSPICLTETVGTIETESGSFRPRVVSPLF